MRAQEIKVSYKPIRPPRVEAPSSVAFKKIPNRHQKGGFQSDHPWYHPTMDLAKTEILKLLNIEYSASWTEVDRKCTSFRKLDKEGKSIVVRELVFDGSIKWYKRKSQNGRSGYYLKLAQRPSAEDY